MHITFLIGNGFDLELGAKTRYSDFYDYLQQNKEQLGNNIFYNEILAHIKEARLQQDRDNIIVNNDVRINWSDFELAVGQFSFEYFDEEDLKLNEERFKKFKEDYHEINYFFQKYMLIQKNLLIEHINNTSEISKHVYEGVVLFANKLPKVRYERIEKKFIDSYKKERVVNFIDFNFTESLSCALVNVVPSSVDMRGYSRGFGKYDWNEIINIHGKIGAAEVYPILGVDNANQLHPFLQVEERARIFQKPLINDLLENGISNQCKIKLQASKIFVIYGMSIGQTDMTWWTTILNQLIHDSSKELIIFEYSQGFVVPYMEFERKDEIVRSIVEMFVETNRDIDDAIEERLENIKDQITVIFRNLISIPEEAKLAELIAE